MINQNKRQIIYDYLLVFILILVSGNPLIIFSSLIKTTYIALTLLLSCLCLMNRKGGLAWNNFMVYSIPIMIIMLYHLVAIPESTISTNILMLICIYIGVVIITLLSDRFATVYINIMVVLSLISIPLWVYVNVFGFLPGIPVVAVNDTLEKGVRSSLFFYTQFVVDGEEIIRNTGMFWESGAHQGFLNLALLLLARYEMTPENKKKLLILAVAVLSTMSTTGYLVFMMVVFTYLFAGRAQNQKGHAKRYFLLLLFGLLFVYLYNTLDFLGAKIASHTTDPTSTAGRFTDYLIYADSLLNHFFLGNSYNVKISTGNGFFHTLLTIGFIGTVYLLSFLYSGIKKTTTPKYALLFLFTFIVMLQGEGFWTHPLFLALPFIRFPRNNSFVISK